MACTKKLINSPETCVDEMLYGFAVAYPHLQLHRQHRVITLKQKESKQNNIGLISGGGSGHEPFCAGFIGHGMLSGVCAGLVFTSPPPSNILYAIREIAKTNSGVLVIIPSYTGDCLNFGLAVENAKSEGINVESIAVGEDCALYSDEAYMKTGKRGMCGLIFVYKIAGAVAARGKSMTEILEIASKVVNSMATIGIALTACSLPGSPPLFILKDDEMELGLGVHGEAGTKRLKLCRASEAVSLMLEQITRALSLKSGDSVAVLINNLGGSSELEQWIVTGEVKKQLSALDIVAHRFYAGHLMTSLDMLGMQICILKLTGQEDLLQYLDECTDAAAWPGCALSLPSDSVFISEMEQLNVDPKKNLKGIHLSESHANILQECIKAAANVILQNEKHLNDLDSGCGDGDCGSTLRRFAESVLKEIESLPFQYPYTLFQKFSTISQDVMGGTSGAIYSLFFTKASSALENVSYNSLCDVWIDGWTCGLNGIMKYSKARQGDRTMLDAMIPALETFRGSSKDCKEKLITAVMACAQAAEEGCDKTKYLKPRVGRAGYVHETNVKDVDAGAYGVYLWINAICFTFAILYSQVKGTENKK